MTAHEKLQASEACLAVCVVTVLILGAVIRRANLALSFGLLLIVAGSGLAAIALAMQSTTGH